MGRTKPSRATRAKKRPARRYDYLLARRRRKIARASRRRNRR